MMRILRWPAAWGSMAALMMATNAAAQYPDRAVRLLVGFAAGGGTDVSARLIAKSLTEQWGKSVVVENKAGADGNIATAEIARARPDGYNLLVTTTSIVITPVQQKQEYDPYTSFEPITLIGSSPSLVVVHPSMPVKNIKELIALAKARPGTINFGSAGAGTVPYLATEMFVQETGLRMTHIPYKGGGPAVIGILSGETQLLFNSTAPLRTHVVAGKLRPIAVTAPKRLAGALVSVPTFKEQGVDLILQNWAGLFGTKGITRQQIAFWDGAIAASVATPAWQAFMESNQWEPAYMNSVDYRRFLQGEDKRLRAALVDLGMAKQ